jgi:hypothetical protein
MFDDLSILVDISLRPAALLAVIIPQMGTEISLTEWCREVSITLKTKAVKKYRNNYLSIKPCICYPNIMPTQSPKS